MPIYNRLLRTLSGWVFSEESKTSLGKLCLCFTILMVKIILYIPSNYFLCFSSCPFLSIFLHWTLALFSLYPPISYLWTAVRSLFPCLFLRLNKSSALTSLCMSCAPTSWPTWWSSVDSVQPGLSTTGQPTAGSHARKTTSAEGLLSRRAVTSLDLLSTWLSHSTVGGWLPLPQGCAASSCSACCPPGPSLPPGLLYKAAF